MQKVELLSLRPAAGKWCNLLIWQDLEAFSCFWCIDFPVFQAISTSSTNPQFVGESKLQNRYSEKKKEMLIPSRHSGPSPEHNAALWNLLHEHWAHFSVNCSLYPLWDTSHVMIHTYHMCMRCSVHITSSCRPHVRSGVIFLTWYVYFRDHIVDDHLQNALSDILSYAWRVWDFICGLQSSNWQKNQKQEQCTLLCIGS